MYDGPLETAVGRLSRGEAVGLAAMPRNGPMGIVTGGALDGSAPVSSSMPLGAPASRRSVHMTIHSDDRSSASTTGSHSFSVRVGGELSSLRAVAFEVTDWSVPDAQFAIESRETCIPLTFGWCAYPGARRVSRRVDGAWNISQLPASFNEALWAHTWPGAPDDVMVYFRLPVGSNLEACARAWRRCGSRVQIIGVPGVVSHFDIDETILKSVGGDYYRQSSPFPGYSSASGDSGAVVTDSVASAASMDGMQSGPAWDAASGTASVATADRPACRWARVRSAELAAALWPDTDGSAAARTLSWETDRASLPLFYLHFHPLPTNESMAEALSACGSHIGCRWTFESSLGRFNLLDAPSGGGGGGRAVNRSDLDADAALSQWLGWNGALGGGLADRGPQLDAREGMRLLPTRERSAAALVSGLSAGADAAWYGPAGSAPDGAEGSWSLSIQQGNGVTFAVRMPNGRFAPSQLASLLERRIHEAWPSSWIRVWPILAGSSGWLVGYAFRAFTNEEEAFAAPADPYTSLTRSFVGAESAGAIFGLRFDAASTTVDPGALGYEARAYGGRSAYFPSDALGWEGAESGAAGAGAPPLPPSSFRRGWADSGTRLSRARKVPMAQTGWGFLTQWPTRVGASCDESTRRLMLSSLGLPVLENCAPVNTASRPDARVMVLECSVQICAPPGSRCLVQRPFSGGQLPGSASPRRFEMSVAAARAARDALARLAAASEDSARAAAVAVASPAAGLSDSDRDHWTFSLLPALTRAAAACREASYAIDLLMQFVDELARVAELNGSALSMDEQRRMYEVSGNLKEHARAACVDAENDCFLIISGTSGLFWTYDAMFSVASVRAACMAFASFEEGDPVARRGEFGFQPQASRVFTSGLAAADDLFTTSNLVFASAALSAAQSESGEGPVWAVVVPVWAGTNDASASSFAYGASADAAELVGRLASALPGWADDAAADGFSHGSCCMRMALLLSCGVDRAVDLCQASQLRLTFVTSGCTLALDTFGDFPMRFRPERFGFDAGAYSSFGRAHLLAPHPIRSSFIPYVFIVIEMNSDDAADAAPPSIASSSSSSPGGAADAAAADARGSVSRLMLMSPREPVTLATFPAARARQSSVAGNVVAPRSERIVGRFVARASLEHAAGAAAAAVRAARAEFRQELHSEQKLSSIRVSIFNPDGTAYYTHGEPVSVSIDVEVVVAGGVTAAGSRRA
jgi:hypothetical protein